MCLIQKIMHKHMYSLDTIFPASVYKISWATLSISQHNKITDRQFVDNQNKLQKRLNICELCFVLDQAV